MIHLSGFLVPYLDSANTVECGRAMHAYMCVTTVRRMYVLYAFEIVKIQLRNILAHLSAMNVRVTHSRTKKTNRDSCCVKFVTLVSSFPVSFCCADPWSER